MEFVNHILITESFLAKGYINTGGKRLSNFLNDYSRDFLRIQDVTMISMDSHDKILSNEAMIPRGEIVIAHELLEEGGDQVAKKLGQSEPTNASMSGFFRGRYTLDIAGRIKETLTELPKFFVIVDPTVSGLGERSGREFNLFKNLPYLIVNKQRLSALFLYD